MAAQFLTTSKLNNIINMINLGRQSGILRVIRGQGATREVGQIKFIDGEPAAALLGQLTGHNALSVLMNWGECVYSFDEQAITDVGDGDLSTDAARISSDPGRFMQSGGSFGGNTSGPWPSSGLPVSTPFSQPPAISPLPQSQTGPSSGFNTSTPGYGAAAGWSYPPGPYSYPGDSGRYDSGGHTGALPAQQAPQPSGQQLPPLSQRELDAVPRRTMLSEHVEQLPLDRRERMVLMLVDGRRSVVDLARLTRRTERELMAVLSHLIGLGLVQMSS